MNWLKFTCNCCDESFNIKVENMDYKEELVCQNCDCSFPKDNLTKLKTSLNLLQEARAIKETRQVCGDILPLFSLEFFNHEV